MTPISPMGLKVSFLIQVKLLVFPLPRYFQSKSSAKWTSQLSASQLTFSSVGPIFTVKHSTGKSGSGWDMVAMVVIIHHGNQ